MGRAGAVLIDRERGYELVEREERKSHGRKKDRAGDTYERDIMFSLVYFGRYLRDFGSEASHCDGGFQRLIRCPPRLFVSRSFYLIARMLIVAHTLAHVR